MSIILKNWYQLDYKIVGTPLDTLMKINTLVEKLQSKKLANKWFFLYEVPNNIPTIRLRMESESKEKLKEELEKLSKDNNLEMYPGVSFSEYAEGENTLFNNEVVLRFANIMSEITQLNIKRIKEKTTFDNKRVVERVLHCMCNNMGIFSIFEVALLQEIILEKTGKDKEYEVKIVKKS